MANLKLENIVSAPIEEGDAGIILKPDGSFRIFTTGHIDAANLTEAQQQQGERLMAILYLLDRAHLVAAYAALAANYDTPEAKH